MIRSVTIAPAASTLNTAQAGTGSFPEIFPENGCSQKKYATASMPNIALDIRLERSSMEKYHVSYVQNCLWKMNSKRYEAASSNTVVTMVANRKMYSGLCFFRTSISSRNAPTA